MDIKETDLPGIGKKYVVPTDDDMLLVIILHDDGKRELYHFSSKEEDPLSVISFSDAQARRIGSIIEGAFYRPSITEDREICLEGLHIDWIKIRSGSSLSSKSIGDLQIRQKLNVGIIAVITEDCRRDMGEPVINPGPDFILLPGQTVVVAGKTKNVNHFEKLAKGE